jgi:prepilin-type N-terminal cleavage/methylation domain-containing protein
MSITGVPHFRSRRHTGAVYVDNVSEGGFSLIELLVSISIVGVLAALSLTAFYVYKNNAELARAQAALRNARLALEAGYDQVQAVDAWTDPDGGPVPAALADMMPGFPPMHGVHLHASIINCGGGNQEHMIMLWSYSCQADQLAWWIRTCGGFEIYTPKAIGSSC